MGVSMVEFALVGPIAFVMLLGAVVLGIVMFHQVQLSQVVRDSARAAAICGSATNTSGTTATLPDGTACTGSNIVTYINSRLSTVSNTLSNAATITVYDSSNTQVATGSGTSAGNAVASCSASAYTVEVSVTYQQPLYLPLVGNVLGNGSSNTRTISAKGEATCEQ